MNSAKERDDFEAYDKQHNIRKTMIAALKENFSHLDMTYSIGGQISFDVFPTGTSWSLYFGYVEAPTR